MGLDFGRPSSGEAPVLEVVSVQEQDAVQQYDVQADRDQMTLALVNSPRWTHWPARLRCIIWRPSCPSAAGRRRRFPSARM